MLFYSRLPVNPENFHLNKKRLFQGSLRFIPQSIQYFSFFLLWTNALFASTKPCSLIISNNHPHPAARQPCRFLHKPVCFLCFLLEWWTPSGHLYSEWQFVECDFCCFMVQVWCEGCFLWPVLNLCLCVQTGPTRGTNQSCTVFSTA